MIFGCINMTSENENIINETSEIEVDVEKNVILEDKEKDISKKEWILFFICLSLLVIIALIAIIYTSIK